MVTLFSDRIPMAMLFQIAWRRQSFRFKSRQQFEVASPPKLGARIPLEANPVQIATRAGSTGRNHGAPSLARLRHVWYRDAVAHDPAYDAYYFVRTDEWVEPKCADPVCAWCRDRPKRHPKIPLYQVPEYLTLEDCVPAP
jgi:hypothetical protein